jgi:hypothetical protein
VNGKTAWDKNKSKTCRIMLPKSGDFAEHGNGRGEMMMLVGICNPDKISMD